VAGHVAAYPYGAVLGHGVAHAPLLAHGHHAAYAPLAHGVYGHGFAHKSKA
jgi:hypothetical protein